MPSSILGDSLGPWITRRLPGTKAGAKKGKPWMWSQWAWESSSEASPAPSLKGVAISARPSAVMPVPASRMTSSPPAPRRVMHAVLPP